jgi:hypothetical protein
MQSSMVSIVKVLKSMQAQVSPLKVSNQSYMGVLNLLSYATDTIFAKVAKEVPPRVSSRESLQFVEDCYTRCITEHAECRLDSSHLPTRLIDVSTPTYKIYEPKSHERGKYIALSYCWGLKSSKILSTSNLADLKQEIPSDMMPVCFIDAILIAKKLNICYIWIDTICILQNDLIDWERESSKMSEVYRNAAFVIAASSSSNPHESFLVYTEEYYNPINLDCVITDGDASMTFKARRKVTEGIHATFPKSGPQDPLTLRAWAFQERELATRCISFHKAEIQWQCHGLEICQCQEMLQAPTRCMSRLLVEKADDSEALLWREWHLLVEGFSSRELTYAMDKFSALSGLAKRFSDMTTSVYAAGMWKDHLLFDIAWQRQSRRPLQLPVEDVAPSFSWASLSVSVDYQPARELYFGRRICHTQIESLDCVPMGRNPFGQVLGGSISVTGPMIFAELHSSNAMDAQSYRMTVGGITFKPNTFQRCACEFSIDTPTATFGTITSGTVATEPTLTRSNRTVSGKIFGRVGLLSLYCILHERYSYEIFLIIGKHSSMPQAYLRLGIGTGKIYRSQNTGYTIQEKPPFHWIKQHEEFDESIPCEVRVLQIELH